MTKEELKAKVTKQQSIINDANNQICSYVNDYIESLPYKVGDKVSCSRCNVCWIASIIPERNYARYSGMIEVRINPAKKDGTRSNREFVLWSMEIDSTEDTTCDETAKCSDWWKTDVCFSCIKELADNSKLKDE